MNYNFVKIIKLKRIQMLGWFLYYLIYNLYFQKLLKKKNVEIQRFVYDKRKKKLKDVIILS